MMQKRKHISLKFFLQKPTFRLGLCSLLFFVCLFLGWCLPLEVYGERTGLALGFALGIIALWISNLLPILVPALLLAIGGRLFGFFNNESLLQALGNPILYVMSGFSIIAMGAESTNFARRFSFLVLMKFGKRPGRILFSFLLATVVLSAFVSNIATTLLVGGLAAQLLAVMEEKSGQSVFGKALMLLIPAGSMIGGIALMNGSPAINLNGLLLLEQASGQSLLAYRTWALFGIPCALASILPCLLIYQRYFHISSQTEPLCREAYIADQLASLGPLSGPEFRWLLYVALMILFLSFGSNLAYTTLAFTLLHLLPGLGTVAPKHAFEKLPVEVLFMCTIVPLFSILFENTGLNTFFGSLLTPYFARLSPLKIMILSALLMALLNNLFVNASSGILSLLVACETPVLLSAGLNPAVILLPTLFLASFTLAFGTHINVFVLYGYGYWNMRDPILPGFLFCVFCAFLFSLLVYLIALAGALPVYLPSSVPAI